LLLQQWLSVFCAVCLRLCEFLVLFATRVRWILVFVFRPVGLVCIAEVFLLYCGLGFALGGGFVCVMVELADLSFILAVIVACLARPSICSGLTGLLFGRKVLFASSSCWTSGLDVIAVLSSVFVGPCYLGLGVGCLLFVIAYLCVCVCL